MELELLFVSPDESPSVALLSPASNVQAEVAPSETPSEGPSIGTGAFKIRLFKKSDKVENYRFFDNFPIEFAENQW